MLGNTFSLAIVKTFPYNNFNNKSSGFPLKKVQRNITTFF